MARFLCGPPWDRPSEAHCRAKSDACSLTHHTPHATCHTPHPTRHTPHPTHHTRHCRTATREGTRASTPPPPSGQMGRLARGPQGGREGLSSHFPGAGARDIPSEPPEPRTRPAAPARAPLRSPPRRAGPALAPHTGLGTVGAGAHMFTSSVPGEHLGQVTPPSCFRGETGPQRGLGLGHPERWHLLWPPATGRCSGLPWPRLSQAPSALPHGHTGLFQTPLPTAILALARAQVTGQSPVASPSLTLYQACGWFCGPTPLPPVHLLAKAEARTRAWGGRGGGPT